MVDSLTKYLSEFDFVDKSNWTPGEWHSEPDKVHWMDNETGYPCLIIRGPHGALNGYVGIPIYHPAYGLSYDGETQHDHDSYIEALRKTIRNSGTQLSDLLKVLPEKEIVLGIGDKIRSIEVHGGLTFSGPSQLPTKEIWTDEKNYMPYRQQEAKSFPNGDSAEWIKTWGQVINDYDKWAKVFTDRYISAGYDEETWWFGFDCAHLFDLCPRHEELLMYVRGQRSLQPRGKDIYRNIEYVENECRRLAKQLKELACYK